MYKLVQVGFISDLDYRCRFRQFLAENRIEPVREFTKDECYIGMFTSESGRIARDWVSENPPMQEWSDELGAKKPSFFQLFSFIEGSIEGAQA